MAITSMKHFIIIIALFFVAPISVLALDIEGEWIQGGILIGKTDANNTIEFLGKKARVNSEGVFVIGLGRDVKPTVNLIETMSDGTRETHVFSVTQREYREQRVEGVPKKTVDIPEASLNRIYKEVALTKAARKVDSNLLYFSQEFTWPAKGIISGVYGSRRYYNGKPGRPHYGVDIAAPQGSPVTAPASGTVLLVHDNMYFSGGTIIVDHGYGITSTFIHLHKTHVNKGDNIEQGQLIAEIGSTGRSTGPHLDWRMNWFNERLDPQLLMDGLPAKND